MAEKAEHEVGSYLGHVASQSETDKNFGPSRLLSKHTYPRYGQKSETGSWFHQTGSDILEIVHHRMKQTKNWP